MNPSSGSARNRGTALLLVLGSLVLLTVLTVAFLNGAMTDLVSSKSYAGGAEAKMLSDSTLNLVMGQIRQATAGKDANGNLLAWASQPGMIRTYDDAGGRVRNFKLYSWDTLSTTGVFDPAGPAERIPGDWFSQPAMFVDLNEPAASQQGANQYPILDPPPLAAGSPYYVEGFDVQGAPVQPASGNPVPMPVKWLYVLENGTFVAPVSTGSARQVRVPGADTSPIVGRIAFWADDESCKININTASEGSDWDTPRTQGVTDFKFANFQPVQNEYQRYPGHPAMTCLSPVLGSLFPVNHAAATPVFAQYKPYFDLAPKLNKDRTNNLGSKAGTVTSDGSQPLETKPDRLYASIDELLFKSNLFTDDAPHTVSFPGSRELTNPAINQTMIEKAKFFLTTSSRAPEVNLFNKPRVLTWPVHVTDTPAYRTPFDSAIAFCGEVGRDGVGNPYPFYFQRQRNDHPTNDLPSNASPSGLGRNRMLLQYLRDLTSRNIPGFGGRFDAKYPAVGGIGERDQILTEIFDYIRCLNLNDESFSSMTHPFAPIANPTNGYPVKYAETNGAGGGVGWTGFASNAGAGQVVPIYDDVTRTKGFGRFPTISEVSIVFIAHAWNDGANGRTSDVNYQGLNGSTPWGLSTTLPAPSIELQAVLLVNFFDPSQGNVPEYGTYSVQIENLESLQWAETSTALKSPIGFPPSAPANVSRMFTRDEGNKPQQTVGWGGNMGFRSFFAGLQPNKPVSDVQYYPFCGTRRAFPYDPLTPRAADPKQSASPGTFYFSGGRIKVHLHLPTNTPGWPVSDWPLSPAGGGRVPLQTITLEFPEATLPLPIFPDPAQNNQFGGSLPKQARSLAVRFQTASNKFGANSEFIVAQDTVRSLRAFPGDVRLVAAQTEIRDTSAEKFFDQGDTDKIRLSFPQWDYRSRTQRLVHSLRESCDYPFYGALLGQLVPGVTYGGQPSSGNPFQDYSSGLNTFSGAGNNATRSGAFIGGGSSGNPGDWDNGFGYTADGPYINKADEGNINRSGGRVPYFGNSTFFGDAGITYFSPNRLMPSSGMFGSLPTGVVHNIPWKTLLFCPNPAAGPAHPGFGADSEGKGGPDVQPPFVFPPDHLLMDLFTMPVVEPYPISEPLSTAGKINMNYQIVPFTYITRNTGLRAVLKAERMTVIPDSAAGLYKRGGGTEFFVNNSYDFRVPINADETLEGFDHYFSSKNDIFRSATQVCNMFLYPAKGATVSSTTGPKWDSGNSTIMNFWNGNTHGNGYSVSANSSSPTHYLTGDNSRERPYATIYPRLTTKSNTFTVHMCVQPLKKVKSGPADIWTEGKDIVTAEYRGSSTIERFIDPSDPSLPDFADVSVNHSAVLDSYYKFRVLRTKQFAP